MVHLIEQLQISKAAFLPDFLAYTRPFCLSPTSPSEQSQSSSSHSPGASFSGFPLFMGAEGALEVFPCPSEFVVSSFPCPSNPSCSCRCWWLPLCYLNPVICARTRSKDLAVLAAGHCRKQGTNPTIIPTPSHHVFSDVLCISWMNLPQAETTFLPQHTFSTTFKVSLGLTSRYLGST